MQRHHSSSNLVITDEVFIADDEPLVELTFGCDTANIYDSLVRMSNIMSKNAKSSNHMEDIVNNLKLFVETNVGKLTRLSSTLDEANRALQAHVVKLQEEIKQTKDQCLRKDEYEVDIRRVKNQLLPCVTFLEDVESKKCYALDMYVREVLKCDMQPVYLTPFKASLDVTTSSLIETSSNKLSARLGKQREELQEVLDKQTDRVNTELRSIQRLLQCAEDERHTNVTRVDDTITALNQRIRDSIGTIQDAADEQTQRFAREMAALDERQKKVVELLGFRESSGNQGSVVFDASATGGGNFLSAPPSSANLANFSGPPMMTPLSPMLLNNNSTTSQIPGVQDGGFNFPTSPLTGADATSAANAMGQMFLSILAASGFQDAQTVTSDEGGDQKDDASVGGGEDVDMAPADRAPGSPERQPNRSTSNAAAHHGGRGGGAGGAGRGGNVRLLARGKSILQTNNPQQQTGLFGTQMFKQFSQLLHGDITSSLDELEVRLRTDLEMLGERLEALLQEKMDKAAFEEFSRTNVPSSSSSSGPRDAQLQQHVETLMKQMEGVKKLKTDVQALTSAVEKKADATAIASRVTTADLTTMQQESERVFQEMSASMVQVHQVLRKMEAQMKSFHNGLAENGILMSSYSGGGGGGGNSPGGVGPSSSGQFGMEPSMGGYGAHHVSRLTTSSSGAQPAFSGEGGGFPSISTGLPSATRKAAVPMRSSSARSGASPSPSGEIRDVGSAHRSHVSSSSSARIPSTPGAPSRQVMQHSSGQGGVPGLHEVVFDMSASTFEVHKKRSEADKKPVVAPRPPSTK